MTLKHDLTMSIRRGEIIHACSYVNTGECDQYRVVNKRISYKLPFEYKNISHGLCPFHEEEMRKKIMQYKRMKKE